MQSIDTKVFINDQHRRTSNSTINQVIFQKFRNFGFLSASLRRKTKNETKVRCSDK